MSLAAAESLFSSSFYSFFYSVSLTSHSHKVTEHRPSDATRINSQANATALILLSFQAWSLPTLQHTVGDQAPNDSSSEVIHAPRPQLNILASDATPALRKIVPGPHRRSLLGARNCIPGPVAVLPPFTNPRPLGPQRSSPRERIVRPRAARGRRRTSGSTATPPAPQKAFLVPRPARRHSQTSARLVHLQPRLPRRDCVLVALSIDQVDSHLLQVAAAAEEEIGDLASEALDLVGG